MDHTVNTAKPGTDPFVVVNSTSDSFAGKIISYQYVPAIAAVACFIIVTLQLTYRTLQTCNHHLSYILDDVYISMAVAKNLALHGIWGVTSHQFCSSSSSLIWSPLIGLFYFVFGVNEITPFLLEWIISFSLILMVAWIFKRNDVPSIVSLAVLIFIVFVMPLPVLVFTGLEHILHSLLSVAFLCCSIRCLTKEVALKSGELSFLCLLAMLLTSSRYEGCALVFVISLLYFLKRRFNAGLLIGLAGALPVTLFGIISICLGWHFLPDSILLKASIAQSYWSEISNATALAMSRSVQCPLLFALAVMSLVTLIAALLVKRQQQLNSLSGPESKLVDQTLGMNIAFIFMAVAHCSFARMDYRYVAYLILTGIAVATLSAVKLAQLRVFKRIQLFNVRCVYLAFVLMALFLARPGFARSSEWLEKTPIAAQNIYEQQYQMALFIKKYYKGQTVALNDIGAVDYMADIRLVDLAGLSTREVMDLNRQGRLNDREIYRICKDANVKIALLYSQWFPALPSEWVKTGALTIPNNVICGGDTVSIYAVDPSEREQLSKNLSEFSQILPKDIKCVLCNDESGSNTNPEQSQKIAGLRLSGGYASGRAAGSGD